MPRTTHSHTTKHSASPTYKSWHMMKQRCTNPKYTQYADYGGRGIDMDPSWANFASFLAEMGERPEGTSLERLDNDKGYWRWNCTWATKKDQQRNRRTNVWLEFGGERLLLSEWAARLGLKVHSLSQRINHGWPLEAALTTPPMYRGRRPLITDPNVLTYHHQLTGANMKLSEAVELYIKLRDKKSQMKAEFDAAVAPIQEKIDQLEAKLLDVFNKTGMDSVKTEFGTAYTSTRTSVSVADRDAFLAYVKASGDFNMLDVRPSRSAIPEFAAANDGELPPGINMRTERVVNVRRSA